MSIMKKTAVSVIAILGMAVSVFAAAPLEPNEVTKELTGDMQTIKKVYVLPKSQNTDVIPKDSFTENEVEYAFTKLVTQNSAKEDVKEHTETISIHTSTSNTQTVISKFEPTMEITTDDGYAGTLKFDYTTLNVVTSGYGKQNYTITETRSYPNLMDADTSLVPKIINKDGATLNLTNISWQSAANDNVDGQEFAVRYTANATYSGTGTKTYSTGYTATAMYKGDVKKLDNDTVTYTAIFTEVTKPNHFISYWWAYLLGLIGLSGSGYGVYRIIRKRKAGY